MARKKILLISYYAFPLNAVSSYRIDSFFNYLIKYGFEVTLITRHWTESYSDWSDAMSINVNPVEIVEKEHGKIIYLPYTLKPKEFSNRFINKVYYLYQFVKGNLQPEIDTYEAFYPYIYNHLKEESYDLMIGSMPPYNTAKMLYKLNKKYKIPYILDFRDFFNNTLFDIQSKSSISEKILTKISLFWLLKWCSNAMFSISISPPFSSKIEEVLKIKTYTITNGFEKERFGENTFTNNDKFTIRYIGSCSVKQDFITFIEGFNQFIKDKNEVVIELIGTMNEEVEHLFSSNIDSQFLKIQSQRISKEETIIKTESADLLLFPTWFSFKGVYSTKIFDYIASKVNILCVKSDHDVIESLIEETKCGIICENDKEVLDYLNKTFYQWKHYGKVSYEGDPILIDFYSRENQSKAFVNLLNNKLEQIWIG